MQTVFRSLFALLLAAVCSLAAAEIKSIDPAQAQAMFRQGTLILDVREPHEYAEAHAPGSLLVPLGQIPVRANEFRAFENRPIILICRSGKRSGAAAEMLAQMGFKSVYNVQGGIIAWEKAGLPLEKR